MLTGCKKKQFCCVFAYKRTTSWAFNLLFRSSGCSAMPNWWVNRFVYVLRDCRVCLEFSEILRDEEKGAINLTDCLWNKTELYIFSARNITVPPHSSQDLYGLEEEKRHERFIFCWVGLGVLQRYKPHRFCPVMIGSLHCNFRDNRR